MPIKIDTRFTTPLLLAWSLLLSLALRLAFLDEPFERDEGFYSAIALQILDGAVPYRDTAEQKGPLLFYLYAFALASLGKSMAAVRIFTALYNLLTLLALSWLTRQVAGNRAGVIAAYVYAVFSSLPHIQAASSNAEVFLALPLVLTVCLILHWAHASSKWMLVLAGLANVAAILIKMVAAPFSLLALGVVCYHAYRKRSLLSSLACFLLPQALVVAAMLLAFAHSGALENFIQFALIYPLKYVSNTTTFNISGPELPLVLAYLAPELLPISVFGFSLIFALPWLNRSPALNYAAMLPWAAAIATLMPGKNFPHYFINLVPFLSAATALAFNECLRHSSRLLRLLPLIPLALFAHLVILEHAFYWKMTPDEVSEAKYGDQFVLARDAALWMKNRMRPEDTIFHWGYDPQVYLIAERSPPKRFSSSGDIAARGDTPAAREELQNHLKSSRPAYIVIFVEWSNLPGALVVQRFIHESRYYLEYSNDLIQLYRRPD